MEKEGRLPADELNRQEPGALVRPGFVGDVDTVETLFTAGLSVWRRTPAGSPHSGSWCAAASLPYSVSVLAPLPVLFLFTRFVQKRMLHNQLKTGRRKSRASPDIKLEIANLRNICTLGKETYMETRYDGALGRATGPVRAPATMTPCIPR